MPTTGHSSQRLKSICLSAYSNIKFGFSLKLANSSMVEQGIILSYTKYILG